MDILIDIQQKLTRELHQLKRNNDPLESNDVEEEISKTVQYIAKQEKILQELQQLKRNNDLLESNDTEEKISWEGRIMRELHQL